ncbi:MAG: tRNA (adenosine(37)-N6)-threonylcarbamoyltransferase complex transferase subunit TsaD [Candidatus Omnitrophica bacterium]|jgi:N6-L-threonylcarbamoyladenine synthase|nr:tRNA (adenosine(37)-N6)-threonylcarbamoyltransferase complex transferase subunit TsaD [Candidatus Omnitrophota bacterium]
MYTLGIETSCDETSVAVVKSGRTILSCETSSSMSLHKKYGGIVPEIAFRMQLETISLVADSAIKKAGIKLKDIKLAAVTDKPGLLGSLLVGISFAKAVALSLEVPLYEINHLYSHIYANFLDTKEPPAFPFVALIVSGGHTSLFYIRDFNKIELLGSTQDDACGEAFDKVAKILGLKYPGGPYIEKLAEKGDSRRIKFGCSDTDNPLDFSFSGIKTAVLYYVNRKIGKLDNQTAEDIAASFQKTVIEVLVKKSLLACRKYGTNRLVVGGGVAANNKLRETLKKEASANKIKVYFPTKALCMDNAAMVAGLAWRLLKRGGVS